MSFNQILTKELPDVVDIQHLFEFWSSRADQPLLVKCDAVKQSSLHFPSGLLTLCLKFSCNRQMHCKQQMFCTYSILYIYWLTILIISVYLKPSSGAVSSAALLQCITIYHSHFQSSSEDWCVCSKIKSHFSCNVCVEGGVCRELTILWMNRSPRMFFNIWTSSVICIFITNLCYSTVILNTGDRLPLSVALPM